MGVDFGNVTGQESEVENIYTGNDSIDTLPLIWVSVGMEKKSLLRTWSKKTRQVIELPSSKPIFVIPFLHGLINL